MTGLRDDEWRPWDTSGPIRAPESDSSANDSKLGSIRFELDPLGPNSTHQDSSWDTGEDEEEQEEEEEEEEEGEDISKSYITNGTHPPAPPDR